MEKVPAPTSAVSWWIGQPETGWFARCDRQFDVRLSCKLGKGTGLPRQNAEAAQKLAAFRSGQATSAKAGIRKHGGFGISERRNRS